jgi:hypothetical protein
LKRFFALCAFILILLGSLFIYLTSSQSQFTWLTPAQFAQANRPGALALLKYKLIKLGGPLMRYYHSHRPNIKISITVATLSTASEQPGLGAPFTTNTDGMSAWVLSPAALAALQQALKTNSAASFVSHMITHTGNGQQAGMRRGGQSILLASGTYAYTGNSVDVVAKTSSTSIDLLLDASSTELSAVSTTNGPTVKTNFFAACRAILPDAGGLVINCRNADATNPTNYWLIVSPVLVDATGKPIKP